MSPIVVSDYDPNWPARFEALRARLWPHVRDVARGLEHAGITSVLGLAAKPRIDLTIVAQSESDVVVNIEGLESLGYAHRGDLGIHGREAFSQPNDLPSHHHYVCPPDNLALENHLAARDHLLANPAVAAEYGQLKKRLAERFPNDINRYTEGKSSFLTRILHASGFTPHQLTHIEVANRGSSRKVSQRGAPRPTQSSSQSVSRKPWLTRSA